MSDLFWLLVAFVLLCLLGFFGPDALAWAEGVLNATIAWFETVIPGGNP